MKLDTITLNKISQNQNVKYHKIYMRNQPVKQTNTYIRDDRKSQNRLLEMEWDYCVRRGRKEMYNWLEIH